MPDSDLDFHPWMVQFGKLPEPYCQLFPDLTFIKYLHIVDCDYCAQRRSSGFISYFYYPETRRMQIFIPEQARTYSLDCSSNIFRNSICLFIHLSWTSAWFGRGSGISWVLLILFTLPETQFQQHFFIRYCRQPTQVFFFNECHVRPGMPGNPGLSSRACACAPGAREGFIFVYRR